MSVYNKPCLKDKSSNNSTPMISHKKNNSMNFSINEVKLLCGSNILYKNNIEAINNPNFNLQTENNINNNPINGNSNINKLFTSTNLKNKRIEIDLEKEKGYINPKFNNSARDNIMLLKNKQSTSQNNIKNKNSFNNINININISKKIISTYYNKSKNKKNILKKNSINSINNSNTKKIENVKYNRINNKDNIYKNPSEAILRKYSNKNANLRGTNIANQNKNKLNYNSLYFSTNNTSQKINKNNINSSSNIYQNSHMNYNIDDINSKVINNFNTDKRNNEIEINNNKSKDNKSSYLSQIQIPMNVSFSPKNINSIQNYFKYLGSGQNKNNYKNNIYNKNQKLSASNINNYIHNNTDNNLYNNTFNNVKNSDFNENLYGIKNIIDLRKNGINLNNYNKINFSPNKKNIIKKQNIQKSNKYNFYEYSELTELASETPEEFHYFFVKLFQKGKYLNFDSNNI